MAHDVKSSQQWKTERAQDREGKTPRTNTVIAMVSGPLRGDMTVAITVGRFSGWDMSDQVNYETINTQ